MSQQYNWPPGSENPSVGVNGNPIPVDSTLVGANDPSGNLQPLNITAGGLLKVDISGAPITGTVTANQGTANTVGNAWPIKLTDGTDTAQVTAGGELQVTATQSGTWTVQPGNMANTTPWLATIAQGGNSATVSAAGALKVDGSASTQPVSGTVTANAGTGTFTVGQATGTNLHTVVDSGSVSSTDVGFVKANTPVYNDYTSTAVTTAAYVQLIAATTTTTTEIEIFDSSGQALYLATGAAASEIDQIIIFPGGNGRVKLKITSGTRVSVKALTANATVGFLAINLYG